MSQLGQKTAGGRPTFPIRTLRVRTIRTHDEVRQSEIDEQLKLANEIFFPQAGIRIRPFDPLDHTLDSELVDVDAQAPRALDKTARRNPNIATIVYVRKIVNSGDAEGFGRYGPYRDGRGYGFGAITPNAHRDVLAHEIGHILLGHKNLPFDGDDNDVLDGSKIQSEHVKARTNLMGGQNRLHATSAEDILRGGICRLTAGQIEIIRSSPLLNLVRVPREARKRVGSSNPATKKASSPKSHGEENKSTAIGGRAPKKVLPPSLK